MIATQGDYVAGRARSDNPEVGRHIRGEGNGIPLRNFAPSVKYGSFFYHPLACAWGVRYNLGRKKKEYIHHGIQS